MYILCTFHVHILIEKSSYVATVFKGVCSHYRLSLTKESKIILKYYTEWKKKKNSHMTTQLTSFENIT